MTLPEVLISVTVIGLIATVITGAIIVTLRTKDANEGRLNVARSEQTVATWLPADLSSAVDADVDPDASPCGAPVCPGVGALGGSNALMLSWPSPGGGTTFVSYHYRLSPDGETYDLVRIECTAGSCWSIVVLHDLEGPDPGDFDPGVTPVPVDVINVTVPLEPDSADPADLVEEPTTARRIVVTINGGGKTEGAGGGVNRVSITAGGTELGELEPEKATGPSFLAAKSRCGGPITIIVDDSGSIGAAGATTTVENSVREFVKALAGTPTQVQIIKFSSTSQLIDESSDWNKYYDMTVQAQVDVLIGGSISGGLIRDNLDQSGGTNWEDAIYRTFYDTAGERLDGDGDPTTFVPGLVVFFTDGIPTFNRTSFYSEPLSSGGPLDPPARPSNKWPEATGNTFDQEGYNRAEYHVSPFRNSEDVKLVGVGVGGIATDRVTAFTDDDVESYPHGIMYRSGNGRAYERANPSGVAQPSNLGGRTGDPLPRNTDAEKVLGNFIVGGALTIADIPYVKAEYVGGEWQNVEDADIFVSDDWSALSEALLEIAVGQCGGTLTMQTRLSDGSVAEQDVTYEAQGEIVTTSRIARAAAFDIKFPPATTELDVTVTPQDFDETGYAAQSWACNTKGAALDPGRWSLVSADPADGITVEIKPNEAISCTLTVAPA